MNFATLKKYCSTTSRTQGVKVNPIAFCLLGLSKHTIFDLKHSSMISLRENGVLANVGTFTLKQILLYNRPHSECRSKNLWLLLIRSIQTYPI